VPVLAHDERQRSAGLDHEADVRAPESVRRHLRQRREVPLCPELVRAPDGRPENAAGDVLLVAWSAARGGEHVLVG
jgi:hypothetical protein